jgi:hypothetical protein
MSIHRLDQKKKHPLVALPTTNFDYKGKKLEVADDIAEDVANNRAKQQENSDNYNGYQDQNQRVLYQALTFFTWKE